MRANKRSVLRWKELRVQYEGWEVLIENQSKLSIMMRSVALCRPNLGGSSLCYWCLPQSVAIVQAPDTKHGTRDKTALYLSCCLHSLFNYWLTPLQKLRKWDKYILLLYYLLKNDFHTHTLSFLWPLNNVFSPSCTDLYEHWCGRVGAGAAGVAPVAVVVAGPQLAAAVVAVAVVVVVVVVAVAVVVIVVVVVNRLWGDLDGNYQLHHATAAPDHTQAGLPTRAGKLPAA